MAIFSPTLHASSISDGFIDQFTRVMHAHPVGANTFKSEFLEPALYSADSQTFVPTEEIKALKTHLDTLAQAHTLSAYYCKYPARYLVMQSNTTDLPEPDYALCPELSPFVEDLEDISIVFAAGYMGNPASYFGHMFIKLGRKDTKLANETLNIGANVPEGENPVLYMLKGLFGSYETQYTSTSYYKQSHAYLQLEGRDLYEYKLALSEQNKLFLSLHLYELQSSRFTYYFTHRNCAYEIYRFLYALPDMADIGTKPLFYPVHLIAYLQQYNLVTGFDYTPANKTKFSQLYFDAEPATRALIKEAIAKIQAGVEVPEIAQHITKEISEALLFYAYAHLDEDVDKMMLNKIKRLRLFFSAGKAYENSSFAQKDLTERPPIMISAGFTNLGDANGMRLTFRPAHYIQTDRADDVSAGGKLVFLQTSLFIGEEILLDQIDIVDVHKSEIGKTGLYGDNELEWGLNVNYRNVYNDMGRFDDVLSASGYIGDVYFAGKNTWLQYGIKGGIRNNVASNGSMFVVPTVTMVSEQNNNVNMMISVGHEFGFYQASQQGVNLEIAANVKVNNSSAISATLEQDLFGRTLSLTYHHYF
ncbi:DUF4105 domain-containing protein [Glaciecola sp. XM2]|uniref:Lnb N-terminal periplasmic domain-containing protein n=1 Tax=Glaciecola sp. XM2 TaxID=1914931 RepID=UPI001BDEC360|nr:DUF4105 domain-containing protein [Glaciecola sp. XM2]